MRLRITFSKSGALRYTGHLDLQTTWERTVRRAGLPLAYTQGFHPGPRIQIASALPLGFIGRAEIVDIWVNEAAGAIPLSDLPLSFVDILQPAAPPGLTIVSVEQVDESGPALQTQVYLAEYEVTLLDPLDEEALVTHVTQVLQAEAIPRERRGKEYNLRPLIDDLSVGLPSPSDPSSPDQPVPSPLKIFMRLSAHDGATGRPEEVLDVLGIPSGSARIERTHLILKSDIE
jgi:radical SAM-linked protein